MQPSDSITRRTFIRHSSSVLAIAAFSGLDPSRPALSPHSPLEHPEPREGITAARVLTPEATGSSKNEQMLSAYDAARRYPELFDGLACGCGCTGPSAPHRSLLVCFETTQPTGCVMCQQEALLVARLAREETSLADIRTAVDKRFGSAGTH
jgi:hypothetical protein